MDLHSALVCTAVPLCLALTGIFYFFAVRLLKWTELPPVNATHVSWIAFTATLLFLLNGGFGFIYLFRHWRTSGTTLWHFLAHLDVNYTHIADKGLAWPNVITDMPLPQLTSIFGLSLGFDREPRWIVRHPDKKKARRQNEHQPSKPAKM
jgi:hypothetical protein